jgi:chaperonin GroES
MTLLPLHEKILVLPFPTEKETASGIIIPDTVQERPSRATVVAVGNGTKDRVMEMKVGDVVGHIKNAGTPIEVDGVLYYMLRDVDCHYRIPKD